MHQKLRVAANGYQLIMAFAVIFLLVLDSTTDATWARNLTEVFAISLFSDP